jgi:DNA repair exonuclease SbcCD ATPase subunit
MKFSYVKFKNFLSFGGDILYEISLDEPGITLITGSNNKDGGSNGSGKSTAIVEAIVYAIFGTTTKDLKANQVVNNKAKQDCYVEICFSIKKDTYVIKRYREHSEFKTALFFEKNGTDITREKIRDTQNLIESIILVGFKSFVLSIVLSQENIANFAKDDPIERKKIIENLLMFDWISRYHKGVKEILRKINAELEAQKVVIAEKEKTVNTLVTQLMNYVEKWEADQESKKKRIAELVSTDLDSKLAEQSDLHLRAEEQLTAWNKHDWNRKNLSAQFDESDEEVKDIQHQMKLKKPTCFVCGSLVSSEHLLKHATQKLEALAVIGDELKLETELYQTSKNEYDLTCRRAAIVDAEVDRLTKIKTERDVLESQINRIIEEDGYVISAQAKVAEVKAELRKAKRKANKLEEEFKYYDWWKVALGNGPTSIKTFCVNYILTSLNKYIKYYLDFFNYDVSYSLNAELQDAIIKDDEEVTFAALSGGEKRSVEITLIFALYEIVRLRLPDNINIIVLDELLSNYLDDVRITGALEILSEFEKRGLSIFVIDHKNLVKESLDCSRIINIVKDKDAVSSLEIL